MEIELGRIMRAVRRFWWIALAMAIVFGGIATAMGTTSSKSYTSDATILVLTTNPLVGNPAMVIELAQSERILAPILNEIGIDKNAADFARDHVKAKSVDGTSLVRIEVTYSDAQVAADIANGIVGQVSIRVYDLGLSVLQRNLDNLVFEHDQITNRLATVNVQIDQITSQSGELSAEDESLLSQLQADRLRMEQQRADLARGIRSSENEIATYLDPVMVNETALPVTRSEGVSPVILGAVGIVLGALVGAAVMLWLELRDPNVRDDAHLRELLPTESIMRVSRNAVSDPESASLQLAANRMAGVARTIGATNVVLVSPRISTNTQSIINGVTSSNLSVSTSISAVSGLLDRALGPGEISTTTSVVLIVEQGTTKSQDVLDVVDILRDLGAASVSAILLD